MGAPRLTICVSCSGDGAKAKYFDGATLFKNCRRARKDFGLKDWFKLEEIDCLGECDRPCNVELSGGERETIRLCEVHAVLEAEDLVQAARSYARGDALPDRKLPGRRLK